MNAEIFRHVIRSRLAQVEGGWQTAVRETNKAAELMQIDASPPFVKKGSPRRCVQAVAKAREHHLFQAQFRKFPFSQAFSAQNHLAMGI